MYGRRAVGYNNKRYTRRGFLQLSSLLFGGRISFFSFFVSTSFVSGKQHVHEIIVRETREELVIELAPVFFVDGIAIEAYCSLLRFEDSGAERNEVAALRKPLRHLYDEIAELTSGRIDDEARQFADGEAAIVSDPELAEFASRTRY